MLSREQENWINHLSDIQISIVPYDPRTPQLFDTVGQRIRKVLGPEVIVRHCGASSLGISGQDEIDVAIESDAKNFDALIPLLEKEFGKARSRYPDRVRFEVRQENKKIDLKLVDVGHSNYWDGKTFEVYLQRNPTDLERYRLLKEAGNGISMKEYYRRKTEFVNEILEKAKK